MNLCTFVEEKEPSLLEKQCILQSYTLLRLSQKCVFWKKLIVDIQCVILLLNHTYRAQSLRLHHGISDLLNRLIILLKEVYVLLKAICKHIL